MIALTRAKFNQHFNEVSRRSQTLLAIIAD
jgi:hypothetical protein